jgi:thiamine-monophosphate kinase
LNGLDEFGLIRHLVDRLGATSRPDVRVGVGDDAAVLAQQAGEETLVTTDAMVEGIHFNQTTMRWQDVGYKCIAVSLSDIAAMGGQARHVVLSIAVPKTQPLDTLEALYDGVRDACEAYGCAVVGGDVVSTTGPFVITSTVLGAVPTGSALLRSGAKVGDAVYVTGFVGSSEAGLRFLSGDTGGVPADDALLLERWHRRPEPQLRAGEILREVGASSCNDISDGLASELNEIAKASGVRLRIQTNRIPIAPAVKNYARSRGIDPLEFAWYGGEDYQLVGTASPLAFARALSICESQGIRITQIGRVEPGDGVVADGPTGLDVIYPRGYNHFA